ncbi:MAG TPA: 2-phospho-L-lactate guanylyltransferase [Terriglobales bacterium]|nr:2-phospho-L-lactate guanylyltransferase [Terriglobales bacterium]
MILVPVKHLETSKQRLSPLLSPAERFALAEAMLQDVLAALDVCRHREHVALVSGDERAHRLARQYGFGIIDDPDDPGETSAIEMATRAAIEHGAEFTLVLPADIPLITAAEVNKILGAAPPEGTMLVPSASGRGTNAVLQRPPGLFPLRFGNDSFLPHLAAARATGKPVEVLRLAGIGVDIDEPADLADLLAAPGDTRAQRLLDEWRIRERLAVMRLAAQSPQHAKSRRVGDPEERAS